MAGMGGMGGGGNAFGAVGGMTSDMWNIVQRLSSLAGGMNDQRDINNAYKEFGKLYNIDPQQLKIAAQQIKTQPDIAAGAQRADQLNALRQMQNIASQGGMDNAAISANNQAAMSAARQNAADNAAITGSLQRRGLSAGSGAQLAQRQGAAQAAYNTTAMQGAQNAANAQMRALQAIQESGRLSGDIASSEQARMAANADRRNATDRFNTSIRDAANKFNSNAILGANDYNLRKTNTAFNAATGKATANTGLRRQQNQDVEKGGQHFQNFSNNLGSLFGG